MLVYYNDEIWGDILECGLAMAYDVTDPGNISSRDRLESMVLARMGLAATLSSLVFEACLWAYTIGEIRIIVL